MAVGEEAVLLPTHTPSPRRVGGAIKPTSPARRVALIATMCVMGCALVATLSHVSAGARYYGLVAAHKQAAATQELYEYYNQMLDQATANAEAEHPVLKQLKQDPLHIQSLEEISPDPLQIQSLEDISETMPKTQGLAQTQETVDEDEAALDAQIARLQKLDVNKPATQILASDSDEAELDARIAKLEKIGSQPQSQMLATLPAWSQPQSQMLATDDEDEVLNTHQQSLVVLQQMLAKTQRTIEEHKHRMLVKDVVREVLAALPRHVTHAAPRDLAIDLDEEEPSTQKLAAAHDAAVHAKAMGMLQGLISQAKAEVMAEQQRPAALATKSDPQFQVLDEDEADEDVIKSELSQVATTKLDTPPAPPAATTAAGAATTTAAATATTTAAAGATTAASASASASSVSISAASNGASAEDILAKKVAEQLLPSIGEKLTAQIMAKIEGSLEKNEKDLETQIKSAAVSAAEKAINQSPGKPAAGLSIVTTVEKGADGVTKTTITKTETTEAVPTSAPTAAPVPQLDDTDIKQLEAIAVQKAKIDADLMEKERAIIAKQVTSAPTPAVVAVTTTTTATTLKKP